MSPRRPFYNRRMSFVHLRTHTEYSVVDGTLRIDEMVRAAAADRQVAASITDLNNLFGAVKFYKAARAQGIKPILGVDVWMEPCDGDRNPSRLLLLLQNRQGYLNACELLSRGWTANTQRAQAWMRWEWLDELSRGLIALSGGDAGALGAALLAGDERRARVLVDRLATCFPGRFYIELQRAGLPVHEAHVRAAVPLAAACKLPVVATHPVHFATSDDFEAHETRVCIADGETLANPRRIKRYTREHCFKTQAQMEALFADIPSALAHTVEIARRCNVELELGRALLPDFQPPAAHDGERLPVADHLRLAARQGLERRLDKLYRDPVRRERERPRYAERLAFELETIVAMGFPGYFLIVADFIRWARDNGCPVGPGRGSGAGSLVAYSLAITDLDPLHYGLLFERFLNPERVSMPDFDIDFCQANRDRVIEYVKGKYGLHAVSQIATFGTMAAKAALRDVGRVLGMGYGHVDSIAKLIPAPPGKTVTLARVPEVPDPGLIYARKEAPELERREKAEEEVAELLALATRVEGIVRNVGMHAGGVLIAPGRITDFCPLYQQPGSASAVSQYDKDDVEAIGLVKFDFLGLATLTILELARTLIVARDPARADFSFDDLPLDDPAVYELFAAGRTESVFQFESRGMQGMLRDARPSRIEDLIALNAMFRPGPMEHIPSFCARKNGKEPIEVPHPLLEQVLGETYGIMVYQEQVMQAAQLCGGYSLGGADLLRRAMGKKKADEMARQRETFRAGAKEKGIERDKADEIFDLMEKFAGYGFNKSHAAAYSLLAYHTAWLKVRHPAVFYAANMTVELDNTDKLRALLADAKGFGIAFDAPDINRGTFGFEPVEEKRVRYGLGAIKGTGQSAIEAVVAARDAGGTFGSLFDFCARVDRTRVNKRTVEALVKAGAFDALEPHRASLVATIGLAFEYAETQAAHADQGGLFDFAGSHAASTREPALVDLPAWDVRERLTCEKAALGFHLSGHLFDEIEAEVRQFVPRRIADLIDSREPQLVAGIVSDLRIANGQRGRVAIFKLDDTSEAIEAVVNEELLDARRELLKDDELIVVSGRAQPDRFGAGLRLNVQQVWDLGEARCRFGRYLRVAASGAAPPVADLVRDFPPRRVSDQDGERVQGLAVRLVIERERARCEVDLGDRSRFFPSDLALARWRHHTGGHACVVYDTERG